jgi:hypothetical protein
VVRLLIGTVRQAVLGAALGVAMGVALPTAQAMAANDFYAIVDLRAVAADGVRSFLNGGLGELRFDDQHDGVRLGSVSIGYRHDFFDIVHFTADAVAYGDHDRSPLDLTEIYAEVRPYPWNSWRSRLKLGVFYAPISLENRLQGWRSAYSLSPSAINTWIGEEFRTIGAEYDLDWLGRQRGHDWELGATAAAYGWNDFSGAVLAISGWAIHDRQTTLFGRVGEPDGGPISGLREFHRDDDQRLGYYLGGTAKYLDALELRVLHYDNRANPNTFSYALHDFAWRTMFNSAGVRWTPTGRWTVIAQWLAGTTVTGDSGFNDAERTDYYGFEFHAAFVLVSWQRGANRLSGRYDGFEMHQTLSDDFFNTDRGHAWTFAYERQLNKSWSVVVEALQIDSSLALRSEIGEPIAARERELQLAVRFRL